LYMLSHYKGPEPEKVGLKSFEFNYTCEWWCFLNCFDVLKKEKWRLPYLHWFWYAWEVHGHVQNPSLLVAGKIIFIKSFSNNTFKNVSTLYDKVPFVC